MSSKINQHALKNQEKWIKLNKKEVKSIFIYYGILFSGALSAIVFIINKLSLQPSMIENGNNVLGIMNIIYLAFFSGLFGSTFYYIRKLYKSCIQLLVKYEIGEDAEIQALGAKVYFYCRPIMGAALSMLVVLGIYGGFFVLLDQPTINADKFYLFIIIIAFLFGFSNGKIIIKLDNSTDKIADMIKICDTED